MYLLFSFGDPGNNEKVNKNGQALVCLFFLAALDPGVYSEMLYIANIIPFSHCGSIIMTSKSWFASADMRKSSLRLPYC